MEFSIKKKNIKWVVTAFISVAALVIVITRIVQKQVEEERQTKALEEYVEQTIKREYDSLISTYESYKETMMDYDYSRSFRWRYAVKINKLVGYSIIKSEWDMHIDSEMDKEIRSVLKENAKLNAYEKLLEE